MKDLLPIWKLKLTGLLNWSNEEKKRYSKSSFNPNYLLPQHAEQYLNKENPYLLELKNQYLQLKLPVNHHSAWGENIYDRGFELHWFRGDNVYLFQYRQFREEARNNTYLSYLDFKNKDSLGLLEKLKEDGFFGCWDFEFEGIGKLSRDLLDSINEINYLNKHIHFKSLPQLRILDIGAGYGRLAHRMCEAIDHIKCYDCIDAIAESTFICDYYLKYRKVDNKARSVPLTNYKSLQDHYDIAINIHSFSECTYESVRWWLDQINERRVDWLLIVPNDADRLVTNEGRGEKISYANYIKQLGYVLVDTTPVYEDNDIRKKTGITDYFYLFKKNWGD